MAGPIPFRTSSPIYKPGDIHTVLDMAVNNSMLVYTPVKGPTREKAMVYNVPAAFDIETTSFYTSEDEKAACMYEWTFGINGYVIIGREWSELMTMFQAIVEHLQLSPEKQLYIYVHNLGFEFQFIRKRFEWVKVFSSDSRKPIEALTVDGLMFKCSFMLSGYALAKLGDELQKYKVEKMVGDLDYSLKRHSGTPLTAKELKYCENDVRVVMAYIQEQIETEGNITKLPMTKTGYVRRYCRDACLYKAKSHKKGGRKFKTYREYMEGMQITSPFEYDQLKKGFQGGFTHANAYWSDVELENVASYDFTSSYPYVMVSEMFPISTGREVKLHSYDEFTGYLKRYCCLFNIRFYNIVSQIPYENPISSSRCGIKGNYVLDNGRVVWADELTTVLTEQDYSIIQYAYKWDKCEISHFRIYEKGYLPTDFVKAILKLYSDKTTLKGVKGKETEYLFAKGLLNSCYGMAVTDIVRDEQVYTAAHTWEVQKANVDEALEQYNKSKKRFLFYPWGVWVTAYARRNLFTGIFEFKEDYVYSDTDSVKVLNADRHRAYIEAYNKKCRLKLERACQHHGISFEAVEPVTIKGEKKLLGVWDFEGVYTRFKTLGAKRYMVEKDGKISITVSGVNKKVAVPYLLEQYGHDGVFKAFDNGLYIPPEYTGKNTHTYIDEARDGVLVDYMGTLGEYHELSCTHLEEADYSMSMSKQYLDYLLGVRQVER